MRDFIVDLDTCLVELKSDLDPVLYSSFSIPDAEYFENCFDKLNDRAIQELGRKLNFDEENFVCSTMMLGKNLPAVIMASIIDQFFYWKSLDVDVLNKIAGMGEK